MKKISISKTRVLLNNTNASKLAISPKHHTEPDLISNALTTKYSQYIDNNNKLISLHSDKNITSDSNNNDGIKSYDSTHKIHTNSSDNKTSAHFYSLKNSKFSLDYTKESGKLKMENMQMRTEIIKKEMELVNLKNLNDQLLKAQENKSEVVKLYCSENHVMNNEIKYLRKEIEGLKNYIIILKNKTTHYKKVLRDYGIKAPEHADKEEIQKELKKEEEYDYIKNYIKCYNLAGNSERPSIHREKLIEFNNKLLGYDVQVQGSINNINNSQRFSNAFLNNSNLNASKNELNARRFTILSTTLDKKKPKNNNNNNNFNVEFSRKPMMNLTVNLKTLDLKTIEQKNSSSNIFINNNNTLINNYSNLSSSVNPNSNANMGHKNSIFGKKGKNLKKMSIDHYRRLTITRKCKFKIILY